MPFNLLLLPLLGGFIFFSHWNRTAFFAKRQDKERLLLYSSLYGVFFLGVSFLLSIIAPRIPLLMALRLWWAYSTPPIQFSGISTCALLLGVLGQFVLNNLWPFNHIWNPQAQGKRAIERHGSELEKLLYRSLVEGKRVMATLKGGKVYIGRVTKSVSPKEEKNQDLLLLPSKSGYRDEKHRLILTTDYDRTYSMIVDAEEDYLEIISDFGVVIPISEVLTASLYRADVHAKYFPRADPPDPVKELKPPATKEETPSARATAIGIKIPKEFSRKIKFSISG